MKRIKKITLVTVAFYAAILLISGLNYSYGSNDRTTSVYPIITEISPARTDNNSPWIEIHNPYPQKISASKLTLIFNDTMQYSIPKKLPVIPPNGFVILKFDGQGEKLNEYRYKDNIATLHLPSNFIRAISPKAGQIATQFTIDKKNKKLINFVAWGTPASQRSLTPERNLLWSSKWFVNTSKSFGDYDPQAVITENFSIGLYPGGNPANLADWVVYSSNEMTPGRNNTIPSPSLFTLSDNAEVKSEDIAIGWTTSRSGDKYKFQIAKDPNFNTIIDDKILELPLYKPANTLPEGLYYYRVKVIDKDGNESVWSKSMKLISKKMTFHFRRNSDGTVTENVLTAMVHKYQRKDSGLLCLDGCASDLDATTVKHWDNGHPNSVPISGDHGDMNCVRTSISMMVSFYGHNLSIDRIAYYTEEEKPGEGNNIPEGDLAHRTGMSYSSINGGEETDALEWALDATTDFMDANPTFAQIRGWIDNNRPIMTRTPGHMRAMNGYRIDDSNVEWVHIMDPWSGPRWETYTTWNGAAHGTWVGPVSAPTARDDEPGISTDSDSDGIMDFDEQIRFITGRYDKDSDNDGVEDKNDLREYVFNASDAYSKRTADFDADGVRKEKDPDNDADTYKDGSEDANHNGKYEPTFGESNNFAVDAGLSYPTIPIHTIIVFDRSGSMVYPPSDPVKKYDEASSAAVLFLDTWLANSPPANTKVGLVFYDHNAYYDMNATLNTALDILDNAKRNMINNAFVTNRPNYGTTSIGGGILKAMDASGFNVDATSADDQNRMIIVLTDGMENTHPYMDDPLVIQKLVNGKVDGYVLGIGDETQIDVNKLNSLSDILNHYPASFAKDLSSFDLEKFFLQTLAETQGLEFSTDPVDIIVHGNVKYRTIPVSAGTDRVTFVVAWNKPNIRLSFTLKDPSGHSITPNIIKTNTFYQISTKIAPAPGIWTITITPALTGAGNIPETIPYSLMALEKNSNVNTNLGVRGGFYRTGQPIFLSAYLSELKKPKTKATVSVEVTSPKMELSKLILDPKIKQGDTLTVSENGIRMTSFDKKRQAAVLQKYKIPRITSIVTLNDNGVNGDEIPGDGLYSAYFKDTKVNGIYMFKFKVTDTSGKKRMQLSREKTLSVLVGPQLSVKRSAINILQKKFNQATNNTYFKLKIVPTATSGTLIGPGNADLLRLDVKNGNVTNIIDNLDGTYEVEMLVPGSFTKPIKLIPKYE